MQRKLNPEPAFRRYTERNTLLSTVHHIQYTIYYTIHITRHETDTIHSTQHYHSPLIRHNLLHTPFAHTPMNTSCINLDLTIYHNFLTNYPKQHASYNPPPYFIGS
ncbi:hypothetical protein EON63_08890 [archaeon]|nr:MAG: hypothetical protein EON63_08890 [archaeon]